MPTEITTSPQPLGEISQGPGAFEQFLDRNQKNLIIFAILLAIAAAAFVIHRGVKRSQEESAGAALSKAEDLASLQAVVQESPETAAAGSAMLLLANRQWTEGQQDAAIETLQKFIAEKPGHPARATARASLGSKLMTQGKTGEAEKVFQELADDTSAPFLAPFALVSLGDLAKNAGDAKKAEEFYDRANKFSKSTFADTANRRIALLKAKPPVEIEPPPKPATPPADGASTVPPMLAPNAPSDLPSAESTPVEIPAEPSPTDNQSPAPPAAEPPAPGNP